MLKYVRFRDDFRKERIYKSSSLGGSEIFEMYISGITPSLKFFVWKKVEFHILFRTRMSHFLIQETNRLRL